MNQHARRVSLTRVRFTHRIVFLLCSVLFPFSHASAAEQFMRNKHPHSPQPATVSMNNQTVVIFGDSLSDNGNTHALLRGLNEGEHDAIDMLMGAFTHVLREQIAPYALIDGYLNLSDALNYAMYVMILPGVGNIPVVPSAPYFDGRFSNGKVWPEYLANNKQMQVVNMAFGGSWVQAYDNSLSLDDLLITGEDKLHNLLKKLIVGKILPPSLQLEIAYYFNDHYRGNSKSMYLIWAGGNDYINKPENVNDVIQSMRTALVELINHGGKHIRVVTLPNLGMLPRFYGTPMQATMTQLVQEHNRKLVKLIAQLKTEYPTLDAEVIDIYPTFERFVNDYKSFGFTYNHKACGPNLMNVNDKNAFAIAAGNAARSNIKIPFDRALRGIAMAQMSEQYGRDVCDTPEDYLFWDDIHPTTRVHAMIAKEIYRRLSSPNAVG